MLSELNMVGKWFQSEPEESWGFGEFSFNERTKLAFSKLDLDIQIYEHSARINITTNKNQCYIPSHYFLYVLKLQPLVSLLSHYMDIFDQIKGSGKTAVEFDQLVNSRSPSNSVTNTLDSYSRDNFFRAFSSSEYRLGGKNIINKDSKKGKKYRSQDDFMCSILLKALPVPDASSGVLGDLLYAFSKSNSAYEVLMDNYSAYVPHLLRGKTGDELLFMVLSSLGWQGKLDNILGSSPARLHPWESIPDAFLMSTTPVPGNERYITKPVHYSTSCKQYVHIKKGLLDSDELIATVSELISALWPNTLVYKSDDAFLLKSSGRTDVIGAEFKGATNKIFYGAPGTGKSHKIHTVECVGSEKVVTVFHPDTQYNDFVGALKPVMQTDLAGNPTVTYQFRPGPFTNALVKAKRSPSTHVCLVIEEINRAPAAAVFGELFQLLDRKATGESTYKIDAADPDMLLYINERLRASGVPELTQLEIPSNLSILATMNSSDQAVMPLDTAFKRRWGFEYLEIDFSNSAVPQTEIEVATGNGKYAIKWPDLAQAVNDILMETGIAEDRLIGPFFLNPKELGDPSSAKDALNGKLFVYLWDDVLRHIGQHKVFSSSYKTFGGLSAAFNKGLPVFSAAIEGVIEVKGETAEVPEAAQDVGE
ncbi:AAA domain-containing protein [Vibrio crassostreae]|uniref:McrB family protein n=1 Tax=Vibrio crassostreae TaxID=246167 RepID=UPI00148CC32D|nr:AAA family ATPase [Vibrio crassostreae]NOI55243.1 AAA domain-containing protein [Vibrio crassostreae]